jgi:CO/xanthine dehydrogenase Mo-binding subunit
MYLYKQAKCTWRAEHTPAIIDSFNAICVHHLSDILGVARRGKKCPGWMSSKVWDELEKKWELPAFQQKSARNKINRHSENGGSVHTGGSISILQHRDRMVIY